MTEGERWATELLADLRAQRYTPRAWCLFLARSFRRAGTRRRERRRAGGQVLGLGAAGVVAWAGVAAAGRPGLAAAGAGWWLAVVLMLDWHLGMLERPDGTALDGLGLANAISLVRAGLVPALPALSPTALAVALAAAHATDILDGRLARARGEVTRLGLWLDGAVDTLLLGVAAVAAARIGAIPGWAAGLVVVRCALPWLLAPGIYFVRARAPRLEGHVPGRLPGFVLLAGLVTSPFWAGGTAIVAAGAAGGLLTLAASAARSSGGPAASERSEAAAVLERRFGGKPRDRRGDGRVDVNEPGEVA